MAVSYGTYTITDIQDITITSTSVTYQKGTSGTIQPTGTWLDTIPSIGEGEYLWTKTVVTYSDSTETESYSVSRNAINGTNGNSPTVVSTIIEYVQSNSGTLTPTSGWNTTPPTAIAGEYIWTKVTVTYSDEVTAISYNVAKNGIDGKDGGKWYSGDKITGTSTTATIFSNSGITSAVVGDMYLNINTYNTYRCTLDGDASTAKWIYVNNIKGNTGKGISSIQNLYCLSSSNIEAIGTWDSTPQAYVVGKYYWTKSHIIWSDNTSTDTTPVLDNALTDANANAIDARKVATNYLAVDNTGIMVADMKDGEQLPSTATGRNVFIDNDSVDIRDGQRTLASFRGEDTKFYDVNSDNKEVASFGSNGVRVGNKDEQHFIVDAESMQAINENGSPIFSVTSTGGTIATDVVVAKGGNSQGYTLEVILSGMETNENTQFYVDSLIQDVYVLWSTTPFDNFYVDGESASVVCLPYSDPKTGTPLSSHHHVELPSFLFTYGTPQYKYYHLRGTFVSNGGNTYEYVGTIHIEYDGQYKILMYAPYNSLAKTDGNVEEDVDIGWCGYIWSDIKSNLGYSKAPAMTFGTRSTRSAIPPLSVAIGEELYADSRSQLSIGKYNVRNTNPLAFVVGNGTDDENRSNAFSVDWDGNAETTGDLKVGSNLEVTNDIDINGNINLVGQMQSNKKPMFKVVNRAFTSIGIDSGRAYTTKRTISIDGYTPVSIGGIKVTNNMAYNASSYADASWCVVPAFWIDFSDTIDDPNIWTDALYFYIWNMNSSKGVNVDFNVRIVYIATDALGNN